MGDERDFLLERDRPQARPERTDAESVDAESGEAGRRVLAAAGEPAHLPAALNRVGLGARSEATLHLGSAHGNRAVQRVVEAALVQRQGAPEEEEEREDESMVQARADVGLEGGPVPGDVADRIDSSRGGGAPLGDGVQRQMEAAFDTSFADVRVHAGSDADELNGRLHAKAFTTGSDVFVRSDQPSTDTAAGKELIAHELAHVVQQRTMSPSGPLTVGAAGDHHEQAADRAAAAAVAQREVDEIAMPMDASVAREIAPEEELKEEESPA